MFMSGIDVESLIGGVSIFLDSNAPQDRVNNTFQDFAKEIMEVEVFLAISLS